MPLVQPWAIPARCRDVRVAARPEAAGSEAREPRPRPSRVLGARLLYGSGRERAAEWSRTYVPTLERGWTHVTKSAKMPSVTPGTRSTVFTASVGVLTLSVCCYSRPRRLPPMPTWAIRTRSWCSAIRARPARTPSDSARRRGARQLLGDRYESCRQQRVPENLAKNPAIKGHNVNLARGSATVHVLVRQAQRAVALEPKPDLVLIQIMDTDIVCPAKASDYSAFRSTFFPRSSCLPKARPSRASSSSASSGVIPEHREDAQPCRTEDIRRHWAVCLPRSPRPARPEGGSSAREDHPWL